MLTNIYAIYDSKAEAYMQPFFASTHGLALRTFEKHANDPQTIFNQHPGDFTLFHIGSYEEDTAQIKPEKALVNLGTALEQIQVAPPNLESVQ